jgi:hypothetical protein
MRSMLGFAAGRYMTLVVYFRQGVLGSFSSDVWMCAGGWRRYGPVEAPLSRRKGEMFSL